LARNKNYNAPHCVVFSSLLLTINNNQPADFAGAVPSIIFYFHHHFHLKYDGSIDLLRSFHLLHKISLPCSNEIVEDNRYFNDYLTFFLAAYWSFKHLELGI
jgi:hypothetical protein